jgi:hypothetical protein
VAIAAMPPEQASNPSMSWMNAFSSRHGAPIHRWAQFGRRGERADLRLPKIASVLVESV